MMDKAIQIAYNEFFEKKCIMASKAGFRHISVNFNDTTDRSPENWAAAPDNILRIMEENDLLRQRGVEILFGDKTLRARHFGLFNMVDLDVGSVGRDGDRAGAEVCSARVQHRHGRVFRDVAVRRGEGGDHFQRRGLAGQSGFHLFLECGHETRAVDRSRGQSVRFEKFFWCHHNEFLSSE